MDKVSNTTESTDKESLFVIKIGGNIIDDVDKLNSFLKQFASLTGKKILVHGGGKIATNIGEKLGLEPSYINGRRITDDDTISLVTMVYGGLINKNIVAVLQSMQCDAIGITGADGNMIPANKRPVKEVDYGWAGDIKGSNISIKKWGMLLENNFIPVVAPLTHDQKGHMLNTNADTIASALSVALSVKYNVVLIYCFEKKGVLEDINDENSVIPEINRNMFNQLLKANKLVAGILPKLENALAAIEAGVYKIIIGSAEDLLSHTTIYSRGTILSR